MTATTVMSVPDKTEHYVLHTYNRAPFALAHGQGMTVTDTEGRTYLDFAAGISVMALGHSDPGITAAASAQMAQLSHVCNLYYTAPQADLAEALVERSFADKVYFGNSGAEAIEGAIKFARKYARAVHGPGKTGIVAFSGSFHGRTAGALALTAKEAYQAPFRPLLPGVTFAPFNDLAAAEKLVGPETCAVVVEPVQGEGGIRVATDDFLAGLRDLCDRWGALLVFDEIQCGVGRTGTFWAYEQTGVVPDMLTTAKALGGGLPIGAVLLTDLVAATIAAGDHGSTFAGGPVVCAVAGQMVERVSDPDFLAHVAAMGDLLLAGLDDLDSPHVIDVRGKGLMVGLELDVDVLPLVQQGYARGLLLLNAGPQVLRFLPPLIVEEAHIHQLIETLGAMLGEIAS